MEMWVAIFGGTGAALITGLLTLFASRFRAENSEQHAANLAKLGEISGQVADVRNDVRDVRRSQVRHLEWHAENK